MTFYLGQGVKNWPAEAPPEVMWLDAGPVVGTPYYPIAIDLAEAACLQSRTGLMKRACAALAPTWEELEDYGITRDISNGSSAKQIGDSEDTAITQHYLFGAVARAVTSLGQKYGVILRGLQHYDTESVTFAQRLLREAQLRDFHVAVEGSPALMNDSRLGYFLAGAQVIGRRARRSVPPDATDPGTTLVSLCPQGLPLDILTGRGLRSLPPPVAICGPTGAQRAFLSPAARRFVTRTIPYAKRCRLHGELFDAWDPKGWGYLRRAGHAIASRDLGRLLAQHVPYIHGVTPLSIDFLYRHLATVARALGDSPNALPALIGAARLCHRTWSRLGYVRSIAHYRQALRCCTDPSQEVSLIYEIANTHALQRQPTTLARARRWYRQGWAALDRIPPGESRIWAEITLCNGQALVEYLERRNEEALALERRAKALASQAADPYPAIDKWARPLVNTNTAKLLILRFQDLSSAVALFEELLTMNEPKIREHAALNLARLCFDQGDHRRVTELLAHLYDATLPENIDEHEEIFGRLMFVISLLAHGDRERAARQVRRLQYLSNVLDVPGVERIVAVIGRACAVNGSSDDLRG